MCNLCVLEDIHAGVLTNAYIIKIVYINCFNFRIFENVFELRFNAGDFMCSLSAVTGDTVATT